MIRFETNCGIEYVDPHSVVAMCLTTEDDGTFNATLTIPGVDEHVLLNFGSELLAERAMIKIAKAKQDRNFAKTVDHIVNE